jgi:EAL domain-containing protein (putative c-di-GMP-specific phosphodiesterase class I)/GGDEF domain-containing protein
VRRVEATRFAVQPIVNVHTGVCVGVEFLLRGYADAGFPSISAFFDGAWADGVLAPVSRELRRRAIASFAANPLARGTTLFFNLDNRELLDAGPDTWNLVEDLEAHGLSPTALCFELSEQQRAPLLHEQASSLLTAHPVSHKLALDDFGTGFSGLQTLYLAEPDFIKIDRFFIAGIEASPKKEQFVAHVVHLVHLLGGTVIAEGVETAAEYLRCRACGCDLIQGFFVRSPADDASTLRRRYEHVELARRGDRRHRVEDSTLNQHLEPIPPLQVGSSVAAVLERFRRDASRSFFPVINDSGEPVGILRESDLREFAYSPFGRELLRNPSASTTLRDLVVRGPIADINLPTERLLGLFSLEESPEGVLITEAARYVGFLSANALLRLVNEKNLLAARDQNPLTRLPGNTRIYEYLSDVIAGSDEVHIVVYMDLDNFKAFNDVYGFRAGDRAILLFAELAARHLQREDSFLGHVGGDDFFLGVSGREEAAVAGDVTRTLGRFAEDVASLYEPGDRERGYIEARDRAGARRRFPLLTASAAMLTVRPGRQCASMDMVVRTFADLKERAKHSDTRLVRATLVGDQVEPPMEVKS